MCWSFKYFNEREQKTHKLYNSIFESIPSKLNYGILRLNLVETV